MIGNLKNAFVWKDSLATKFNMWAGRLFYQVPQEFEYREFWALAEDRSVPKVWHLSDADAIKARIKLNRFRFMFISHFGRWITVLAGLVIVGTALLRTVLLILKHLL